MTVKAAAGERIVARLHDGLGNQLFIYAAARAIAEARSATLLIDATSGFARDRRYGATSQLHHFAIRAPVAPPSLSHPPPLGRHIRDWQVSLSRHLPLSQRFVVRETDFDSIMAGARLRSLVRLEGYWQAPRYFASIAGKIIDELQVVSPLSAQSEETARLIAQTEAVSLHVRQMHGAHHAFDKAPPPQIAQLPYSYYEEAVERIAARVSKPTFFCFADNFEWIRARWKFPYPIHYVEHNRGSERAHEDLALMNRCRHFVVGNSTFSWWGAWLSRAKDKFVVAPDNRGKVVWGAEAELFPAGWDVLKIGG